MVSDEGGIMVPVFNNHVLNNHVHAITHQITHGDQMSANWPNDGHRYTERWWFA